MKGRVARVIAIVGVLALGGASCHRVEPASGVPTGATRVVVDTDMGPDDAMALLYLLARDDVVVEAVTVSGDGLAHCEGGERTVRALLMTAGAPDTPVACGRLAPLAGSNAFPEEWRAYTDDLATRLDLPAPAGPAYDGTAVDLLLETLDDDTTLLTLGPLTNVAEALRRDPELAQVVPRVVSMAGAVDVAGNAPNRVAEYNVWIDALAAKEVLAALPVELVSLDASNDVPATTFFVGLLGRHLETPSARVVHALLEENPQVVAGTYYFWDPLAAVLVVEPGLATWKEDRLLVTASLDAGAGWISRWDQGDRVRFATHADWERFERGFLGTLSGSTIGQLRPDPDLMASFDGRRCRIEGTIAHAGTFVIRFDNRSRRDASVIVGTIGGITYEEVLDFIGRAGSLVRRAPEGLTQVASVGAAPGASALGEGEADAGPAGAFCLVSFSEGARVWPGGRIVVEG